MSRVLRWAGYGIATIAVLILIGMLAVWVISSQKIHASIEPRGETLATPTPAQVADAERQGRILGCFSCHGEGLRGKKMFDQPGVGTVWAPNLTLVAAKANDQQLARAIRQGIGVDGRSLFIMPSENFQNLSDQQVAAIIAMVRSLPRGGASSPATEYGPLGRLGIAMGKFESAPALVAAFATREPIRLGEKYEAGRRLASLYCSGCHNADLTGKPIGPSEVSPDLAIVGAYDPAAFQKLLRTGVPAGGQKLGMMGATAKSDLSHLNDAEIDQLYAYLLARSDKVPR